MAKKILLIEDEVDIVRILEFRLKRSGFEVSVATDGEAGLRRAREEQPDLIILNLLLPKLPGEEVCRQVRQDENINKVPIIMLTAKKDDVDRIVGRVIGANFYMTKPFDLTLLLEKINHYTGSSAKG